jgi:hypothetical protein
LHTQVTLLLGSVYAIEIERKFNLIHEHEWTGKTVTGICKKNCVSRKTYYKWKNGNIKNYPCTAVLLETILENRHGIHSS